MTDLIERDVAVRLSLIAALAGEHLLLVGPPGTAKSLVARRLQLAFEGASYFERLLTRFTVPEELFGPLSIKGLEEDRYERLTDAYLPKASIAFLDEIFKANSAILNALLTLLNEREFDNGARRERTPLIAIVAASNELPKGEELDALFDRFLLRLHVGPVGKPSFPALLGLRGAATPAIAGSLRLTEDDLRAVQRLADDVSVPEDVVALLCELRDLCAAEKIAVSDRRWRKVVKLLQVAALSNGRNHVSIWDCWLLQHCLWNAPEQRTAIFDWYKARVGASKAMDPSRLARLVVTFEGKLKSDQDSRSQVRDENGQNLFVGAGGSRTIRARGPVQKTRNGEPLFLSPVGRRSSTGIIITHPSGSRDPSREAGYTPAELDGMHVEDASGRRVEFKSWPKRAEYLADSSNWLVEDGPLRPLVEPTRHPEIYVQDSLTQLDRLRADVEAYRRALLDHMASLEAEISSHLWVTPDFVAPAATNLAKTKNTVDALLARIEKVRSGFELLPRQVTAEAPQPDEVSDIPTHPRPHG